MTLVATPEAAIAAALTKCATTVEVVRHGQWRMTLSNGVDLAARARVDDGWLLLDAPLPRAATAGVLELLGWNATLEGGARFALGAGRRATGVRAEMPLEDGVDLQRRMVEMCRGFRTAMKKLHHVGEPDGPCGSAAPPSRDLADLCRETGWTVTEHEAGRLAIDLDVPGEFQQAMVETRDDRRVTATLAVLEPSAAHGSPSAPVCVEALGLLLLRCCGIVRMARAAVRRWEGASQALFEMVFDSEPCAAELAHAFGALSVSSRLASREAAVLWRDERVARSYVDQWDQEKGGVS